MGAPRRLLAARTPLSATLRQLMEPAPPGAAGLRVALPAAIPDGRATPSARFSAARPSARPYGPRTP
eukprot:4202917-Lingulodinium_polyedra.AAC.1